MGREIDIAFALLRGALDGTAVSIGKLETAQWWSLFRLMQQNHVAALASEVFSRLTEEEKPSREVLIPWLSERQKAKNWYLRQCEVQQEIIDLMQGNGIETLVLKGTHLAQFYPQTELREFGDLDLYFYDKHDEADALATSQLKVTVSNQAHHHTKYNYHGVTVESHYDFINSHTPRSNRRYESLLKELAPSPTFEVLFLLRHMACHFAASRITLRDVVDWHVLTKAVGKSVEWNVAETAIEESGMEKFVTILNNIASRRLGSQVDLESQCDRNMANRIEHNIVYGNEKLSSGENSDGFNRLAWKIKRYRSNRWKHPLVFCHDSSLSLLFSSLTSHAMKPQSILHKM